MAKAYRRVDRDQQFLLPPDMGEWLGKDHLAWFLIDVVASLDTSAFHDRGKRQAWSGRAAYDPDMLLTLLLYAYANRTHSSRRIEQLCAVDVAFRVICADDAPDHSTLARFRRAHLDAFTDLFARVLVMCRQAGMVRLGVVALDGTKIAANASKDANRSEAWLREEAERIVAEAEDADAAEDEQFGEARGDELPTELADPRSRKARIRKLLDDIEQEHTAEAEQTDAARVEAQAYLAAVAAGERVRPGPPPPGVDLVKVAEARLAREQRRAEERRAARAAKEAAAAGRGHRLPGPNPAPVCSDPKVLHARQQLEWATRHADEAKPQPCTSAPDDQRRHNLTDPDSRLMPTRTGWIQGYNAQVAASADHIIIATQAGQQSTDVDQFQPMMTTVDELAEQLAEHAAEDGAPDHTDHGQVGLILADAGYLSEHNLTVDGPDRLIAVGKHHEVQRQAREHPADGPPPDDTTPLEQMRHRLRTKHGAATYRQRGATVETVIAHLKDQIGLRRFSMRGLEAVQAELDLAAATANLLKLHRAGWTPA